ncbi:MAG TPA: hypothetical protein VNT03_05350 [Baekduia sp.]|nr:hypothetical protein [Baekduia sp.]
MRLRLLPPALLTATALAAAAPPVAAPAVPPPDPGNRPHSRVVTYDRGVRVGRLQVATTRSRGRLHAHVAVTLRNETAEPLTRYVHVGRCTGGAGHALRCPATTIFGVAMKAGETRAIARDVTLRQPPAAIDAIEVQVRNRRTVTPAFHPADGELLLKGNAWRGPGSGRVFGVVFPALDDRATRLSFDVPQISAGRAYVAVTWQGTAAPGATTIARCTGPDCAARPLSPALSRSGPQRFGARFGFESQGAPAIRLAATADDGTSLVEATLPWPARP